MTLHVSTGGRRSGLDSVHGDPLSDVVIHLGKSEGIETVLQFQLGRKFEQSARKEESTPKTTVSLS